MTDKPAHLLSVAHAEGRKTTWFELFFDLVFVTAVAGLASRFGEHYTLAGAVEFAFLFLVLWWLWLGHTFHATRFDEDRLHQRLTGLAQMLAMVIVAYGTGDAFGERVRAFALGIAAFKALLAMSYLSQSHRAGLDRLVKLYAAIYSLQALAWTSSVLVDPDTRLMLWIAAFALDVVSPFIVAKETWRAPPHPEHLPERFGLFTIILLGESFASAAHGLDHAGHLTGEGLAVAACGTALAFLFWTGYFHRARGSSERHVADAASGQKLRLWAYGHIPLYLGIAGMAAGTLFMAHHTHPHGAEPWLYSGAAAMAMFGVTLVAVASRPGDAKPGSARPYIAIALLTAFGGGIGLIGGAPIMALAILLLACLQVFVSVRAANRME
ncbi:low temperature requirement protein A (plasmid) [Peteryoungia desertarenae]|uniref:Low temperature requirement protein A n=1 Tax=Peteryoungia desertarenae TaxID=1813451 RepID=A0ABX6QSZ4_9HYPH|nr:low temperature requirement protein A [Peteryoungia desertarenae]QLF71593.1 low temperature requirement protein A [Peteryoungia desertarenae]